jgi:membrane protein implicated in regulation of membrane protease activity
MKHLNLWISVSALVASLAAIAVVAVPTDLALRGLAWVTLGLAASVLSIALVVRRSSSPSTFQSIQDVEDEPQVALAPAVRHPIPSKGSETR